MDRGLDYIVRCIMRSFSVVDSCWLTSISAFCQNLTIYKAFLDHLPHITKTHSHDLEYLPRVNNLNEQH